MKVLIVAHNHPRFHPGGTETVAWDLHRTLRDQGHDCYFLAGLDPVYRPEHAGTELQALPDDPSVFLFRNRGFDPFMQLQTRYDHLLFDLKWLLEELAPEVVHIHHLNYFGIELLALIHRVLPRTRIVYTLHDYYLICPNDGLMVRTGTDALCDHASPDRCYGCFPEKRPATFQVRRDNILRHLHHVDRFTAPSAFLKERFVGWGIDSDRIEVHPNGLPDLPALKPEKRERRNRFATFGNVRRTKGSLLVAEAAVRAVEEYGADLTLTLHGEPLFQTDAFKADLEAMVARSKGTVRLAGRFEREKIGGLMAETDWVVCPSLWWENAPLVIQEAFQNDRPVVCSDIGGMAESVRDGVDGVHVAVGDVDAWARTLAELANAPERWRSLALATPKPTNLAAMTSRFTRLYHELVRPKKTAKKSRTNRKAVTSGA